LNAGSRRDLIEASSGIAGLPRVDSAGIEGGLARSQGLSPYMPHLRTARAARDVFGSTAGPWLTNTNLQAQSAEVVGRVENLSGCFQGVAGGIILSACHIFDVSR